MLKTLTKRKKQRRDEKIVTELNRLIAQPGAMQTACIDVVCEKFDLSRATVYKIIKVKSSHGKSL